MTALPPVKIRGTLTQLALITCMAKFQGWFAWRQWGKSHAARLVIDRMLRNPNFRYMFVVPEYGQGSDTIFEALLSSELKPYIVRIKRQAALVESLGKLLA
jgi:hypothetical protein